MCVHSEPLKARETRFTVTEQGKFCLFNWISQDAKLYADDNDVDLFMEVSSSTGENVENLFLTVGELHW